MAKVQKVRIGELDVVIAGGTDGMGGGDGPLGAAARLWRAGDGSCGACAVLQAPRDTRAFAFPAAPIALSSIPEMGFGMMDSRAWWLIDIERIQMDPMARRFDRMAAEVPARLADARDKICNTRFAGKRAAGAEGKTVLGGFRRARCYRRT